MPEALLKKVKAEELERIARGLVNVAIHQGFTVNITMDFDGTDYKHLIDVMPIAEPSQKGEPSV